MTLKKFDNILKSLSDKRLYKGLILENQLKCLLVSDPTTDRSAASMTVNTGSMQDPDELPGLAHFCEHMLFMGSKKYPVENEFSKFISDHAGSDNAYTDDEHTNYYFDIETDDFKDALDIFAQFFIEPLFNQNSTDREILAVDSENQKNQNSDMWRIDQLDRSTSRADHPYSKYGIGNLNTLKTEPEKLGLDVREELIKFHSKFYSANLMALCILGNESLEELETYALEMFSSIPNKSLQAPAFESDPYIKKSVIEIYNIVPVQEKRDLEISWTIPDLNREYLARPACYLTHLIGHEGAGSLLSKLKNNSWCNSIMVGRGDTATGYDFFKINAELTKEGEENVLGILKLIFQYINLLKKREPEQWIFDEINHVGKIQFNYDDMDEPIDYVTDMTTKMHRYPFEDVLFADCYATEFRPDLIKRLLSSLTPQNMRIKVVSKKFEGKTNLNEKWYGTEYAVEVMPEDHVNELIACGLNEDLRLPDKNAFVPSDLDLIKHKSMAKLPKHPRVLQATDLHRLWFKEDTKFKLPKAHINFELRNELAYLDPLHVNMLAMFADLFEDYLTEYSYMASLGGLDVELTNTKHGLHVNIAGFNDKMDTVVEDVFDKLASFKVDPVRFDIVKEMIKRVNVDFASEEPRTQSSSYMKELISEKAWNVEQRLATIDSFSVEDLQNFIFKFLNGNLFVESVVYGNICHEKSTEFLSIVLKKLNLTNTVNTFHANFRQVQLPPESNFVYLRQNGVHQTKAIRTYFQCERKSTRHNVVLELFSQSICESCFDVLRTKEQLGYIVHSSIREYGGVRGIEIAIQSDRSPVYLNERIENFLDITKNTLEAMNEEEFNTHVEALIADKEYEIKNMASQFEAYQYEIDVREYNFDRVRIEVKELKTVTKAELVEFFQKYISSESKERKKLSVYVYPPGLESEVLEGLKGATVIEDISKWRAELPLYELPEPLIKL